MIRKNFLIDEEQNREIENLGGSFSNHLRTAIDDYLKKMAPKAMTSPSVQKCWHCGVPKGQQHLESCEADL